LISVSMLVSDSIDVAYVANGRLATMIGTAAHKMMGFIVCFTASGAPLDL